MSDQALWYMDNIDVNAIFCPNKMKHSHQTQLHKTFKRGEYIYMPEEHADRLYFLTSGSVKIGTYSDDGKEITKAILTPGRVFGEMSLVGENKRHDFAIAVEAAEACIVTVNEMKGLMREHNALSMFLMKILGSKLLKMERRLESLVFKDSRARIVEFLKELADERGQRVGFETVVRGFMTHQEIANLTATSRQTVTTVLNDLRNKNLITFNRRRLLIRDLENLN
ncbi:MAG: Crp/Fnr family transcriptional regulator [Bacteroidota bacterium]